MSEQQETPVPFYPPPEKSRWWPWVLAALGGAFVFFYIASPGSLWGSVEDADVAAEKSWAAKRYSYFLEDEQD